MILDTSFLISFYDSTDSNHTKAVEWMRNIESNTLFLPEYVLAETATVLLYKKGLAAAQKFIETAKNKTSLQIILVNDADFYKATEIFEKQKHQLSFVDAIVVHFAKTRKMNAIAFDSNILKEINRTD